MRTPCLFLITVILFSCSSVTGITKIKEYNTEDMKSVLRHNGIKDSVVYYIDKDYKKALLLISKDTAILKNHLQPLQASYYNKEGTLISLHINCYAPGFPNLNWNYRGVMDVFPPLTQAPVDTLLNLQSHLNNLKSNYEKSNTAANNVDYFIIVGWSGFLKNQSERLINAVRKNLELNIDNKRVKIIYVCTDNVFIE